MVVCLSSARFTMKADILRQTSGSSSPTIDGEWTSRQDPETGEIVRVWVPIDTDDVTPGTQAYSMRCLARGITDGGIRVAGTTERWGETYENIDYVRIWFPASVILSKRDRITNIRDNNDNVIWMEEELPQTASGLVGFAPTVFNVMGVTPVLNPFNRHMENQALLERADVQ